MACCSECNQDHMTQPQPRSGNKDRIHNLRIGLNIDLLTFKKPFWNSLTRKLLLDHSIELVSTVSCSLTTWAKFLQIPQLSLHQLDQHTSTVHLAIITGEEKIYVYIVLNKYLIDHISSRVAYEEQKSYLLIRQSVYWDSSRINWNHSAKVYMTYT